MPMGVVSDKDFDLEKSKLIREESKSITDTTPDIITIEKGRGEGNIEVPNALRQVIGETSVSHGRTEATQLARQFGISPSSVSAYTKGATSTASYDNQTNARTINLAKERITKKARSRLLLALNNITPEKVATAKLNEISSVAKDMSAIIKNMEPDKLVDPDKKDGPTFIFYAPQVRDERNYETLVVKET